jgi:hypothetical protein
MGNVKPFVVLKRRSKDGVTHSLTGPAMLYANGFVCWKYNGEYHRLKGPALYFNNNRYTLQQFYLYGISMDNYANFHNKSSRRRIMLKVLMHE